MFDELIDALRGYKQHSSILRAYSTYKKLGLKTLREPFFLALQE